MTDYYETQRSAREYAAMKEELAELKSVKHWVKVAGRSIALIIVVIFAVMLTSRIVGPKLNLYKSNTEKQAVIKEQEAISEAEVFAAEKRVIAARAEAEARVIEAQGIADAQELIASTLTDEYLQWRYYEVLATTDNQIIYVPIDGDLPVTEATRTMPTTPPTDGES